ncbi:hypothetical protein AHF37_02413 [Paragonimus kellicotti]|nr:hypothetical protein AHF37_02413 [Paragonimus kellicotti]
MNSNSLLNVKPGRAKHLCVGESFLHLIHQFLSALLPDCMHLAGSHSFTEYSSQDSSLSVFLGQTPVILYCPQVLRVWAEVADRLTHFIVSEQCICEDDSVVAPDLTTVEAAILAPFWLAGCTPPSSSDGCLGSNKTSTDSYLSNKDEVALAKRVASLFTAFHQEACLLTTVASNAWIDELGLKLVTLISAIIPERFVATIFADGGVDRFFNSRLFHFPLTFPPYQQPPALKDVPTLQLDKSVLSHNSYQLLVALVHWLRLLSGHYACLTVRADCTTITTDCLPTMDVDRIWIECVRCVLGASCAAPPSLAKSRRFAICALPL